MDHIVFVTNLIISKNCNYWVILFKVISMLERECVIYLKVSSNCIHIIVWYNLVTVGNVVKLCVHDGKRDNK